MRKNKKEQGREKGGRNKGGRRREEEQIETEGGKERGGNSDGGGREMQQEKDRGEGDWKGAQVMGCEDWGEGGQWIRDLPFTVPFSFLHLFPTSQFPLSVSLIQ